MEVLYLFEKNRIDIGLLQTEDLFKSQNYQFEPLSFEILKTASEINDIPELPDRLIAATARYLDLLLITNDPKPIYKPVVLPHRIPMVRVIRLTAR